MPEQSNVTTLTLTQSIEAVITVGPESAYYLSIILDRDVKAGEPFDIGEVALNNPEVNLNHLFSTPLKDQADEILARRKG